MRAHTAKGGRFENSDGKDHGGKMHSSVNAVLFFVYNSVVTSKTSEPFGQAGPAD